MLFARKKYFLYFLIILSTLTFNSFSQSNEIPVIVIAPNNKPQSLSTVGTSVTILDEEYLNNSNEYFLGDILSSNTTSANFFQSGGHGTTSAIQLRGMPKRYSTVYIDGVKMSDPSNVSNDFDFNNILTSQISRVEILKGNQSSVYGSGAIGGTIHITTKKGKPGFNKNLNYLTGSKGTHNLSTSISGGNDYKNYFIGFERFQTKGISQMMHNDEKDRYRNNSLIVNYDYNFFDKFELNSNYRIADTYLQYDATCVSNRFGCSANYDHAEDVDAIESSGKISLKHKTLENFENKFTVANTYIKRIYNAAINSKNTKQDSYYGERYSFLYQGNYNLNLDNSIVFGFEREDDSIGYNKNMTGMDYKDAYVTSKYFDFQKRFSSNIFGTFGSRFDNHSLAENEDSHRLTLAYLFDNKLTKIKSSYGTGFRYPSLYEFYFYTSAGYDGNEKAENSESFDIGIEKSFPEIGLKIDMSYFNIKYHDVLEGWQASGWDAGNHPGTVKSQGLELMSNFQFNKFLNFDLNYTYTSTYDGAEQDDPNKTDGQNNAQLVRVPRNLINLNTNFKIPGSENLNILLSTKWSDMARDYGNGNRTFADERIDDYLVNDLNINYNFSEAYKLYFNITNLFNEKYETARDYSQMPRTFNFGFKNSF